MRDDYQGIIEVVNALQEKRIGQLHEFCLINSGTTNREGLALMAKALTKAYKPIADEIHNKPIPPVSAINLQGDYALVDYGECLLIRKRPELARRVLLCGHMDTVYAATNPFQKLTYLNDQELNGPGVADMKGGLIVMLHALMAFEQTQHSATLGWDVFINADEEIGSLGSRGLLDELAPNYQAALVYEPSMTPSGTLAKNRRGSGKLTLVATGKAAHVGRAFDEGRNAICYLSEAVTAIHALNEKKSGVTINVGRIAGGEALNVVPEKAVAQLDVRITQPTDEFWVREQIGAIITRLQRPDYALTLHGSFARPVKKIDKRTERLFHRVQKVGATLGLTIDWADSGGCCDGNNLAQHGLAVLDTLGVRGGSIHSPDEYIILDSLSERSTLSALLLMDLAQGGLEDLQR